MMMKGQVSIDFIITLSLLMILFLFVFEVALDKQEFTRERIARLEAESKANTLARLIDGVYQAGDGTSLQKSFYQSLRNNRPYNMTVSAASMRVEIRWENYFYTAPIQASEVVAGEVNGTVSIRNIGGRIYVE